MKTRDIHDVAVIGADPSGLSAAFELTRAGFAPLVLESAPRQQEMSGAIITITCT